MTNDLAEELRIAVGRADGQKIVALKLGISESELSRKLNGERGWKIAELQKLCETTGLMLSATDGKNRGDFHLIMELSRKLSETTRMLGEMASIRDISKSGKQGGI